MNIPSSYLEQIRAVYPNVSFDHLDCNQDGMVNDVIVINHDLVCRFAKTELPHNRHALPVLGRVTDSTCPESWAMGVAVLGHG